MPLIDLPLDQLRTYRADLHEPDGYDDFWARTLAEARTHDLALSAEPVDAALALVEVHDVTFAGFGGHPVRAWLRRPAGTREDLPAVVEFVGYGGGRGLPHESLVWAAAGYAHLVMDTRGQGAGWGSGGATPDPVGSAGATPGFLTRGIEDPEQHYYRRVFTDGVRAVEAVRALPGVDASRVAVAGGSQGGAIALAVGGLVPDLLAVMPDVPFLCDVRRAIDVTDAYPYQELATYLSVHRDKVDVALRTMDHVDVLHLARRATAPALLSVALRDTICPPSTVFAAHNHYGELSDPRPSAEIEVYPFNGHEGGQHHQAARQLRWLADRV
ncbi:acetylxylan esterase [Cellulomonas carbonis]|uniref:Acetyl xylan esterase n=1 Tax=Cellulomonas carbonis T26 TaxID=947969 RepID=A0A0A0BZ72_9CELL|nr:acetylxylan esterase [Cellulomonas carbonis]KGM12484.1 acetyl xylan esterase [Cellulomonas carbonis T26]GGC15663.1 acetylxylan esterase [Cellulomonas carbonis]